MSSVSPSVHPSVCNAGGSGPHTLEILETNCTGNFFEPKSHPPNPTGTSGNFGETRGGVGKKWRAGAQKEISLKRVKIDEKLLLVA